MRASRERMQRIFVALFVLCICAGIVMSVSVGVNFSTNLIKLGDEPVTLISDGWTLDTQTERLPLTLPGSIASADGTARISHTVTADAGTQLLVKTSQQTLTAYIDGEQIYTGGQISHTVFGYAMGGVYQIITFPQDVVNAKLTLEFTNHLAAQSFRQQAAVQGSEAGIIMWVIKDNLAVLIFCMAAFIVGVLLIAADVVVHVSGNVHYDVGFSYIGVFSLISSFWILSDCVMFQFVSDNLSLLYTMSYIAFMLVPMPLLLYLHAMLENGRKIISMLCAVTMLNYFVTMILFFAGVALPYLLFTTHAVIILLFACAIYICVKTDETTYGTTPIKEVMYGIMGLCAAGLLALVSFYLNPTGKYILWFCLGIAIFIVMLAVGSMRKSVQLIHTGVENAEFNRVAYMDTLTELGNRAAFERENRSQHQSDSVAVFSMDITGMREINRVHGYEAGNEILRAFARCMAKAGADYSYRIGSDEFAAVIYDIRATDVTRYTARLEENVKAYNLHAVVPMYYTCGNAAGGKETTLLHLLDDAESMRRVAAEREQTHK